MMVYFNNKHPLYPLCPPTFPSPSLGLAHPASQKWKKKKHTHIHKRKGRENTAPLIGIRCRSFWNHWLETMPWGLSSQPLRISIFLKQFSNGKCYWDESGYFVFFVFFLLCSSVNCWGLVRRRLFGCRKHTHTHSLAADGKHTQKSKANRNAY